MNSHPIRRSSRFQRSSGRFLGVACLIWICGLLHAQVPIPFNFATNDATNDATITITGYTGTGGDMLMFPESTVEIDEKLVTWPENLVRLQTGGLNVQLEGSIGGDHREGGQVIAQVHRTGSIDSEQRIEVRVRLVPTGPEAFVQPARSGIDLGVTEHTFEFGPGITDLSFVFDLPDDSEADGLRGFRVEWQSDVGEVEPSWNWGHPFLIEDDEHEVFEQEVAVGLYASELRGGPVCLSTGEALVWGVDQKEEASGERLLFLGKDGQPLSRAGMKALPRQLGNLVHVVELRDGRLLLHGVRGVVGISVQRTLMMLAPDGSPDARFASGMPVEIGEPAEFGYFDSEMDRAMESPDGTLWMRTMDGIYRISSEGMSVKRLEGTSATANGSGIPTQQIMISADGFCWVLQIGGGVRRYRPDGSLDPAFPEWLNAPLVRLVGVDREGRCYLQADGKFSVSPDREPELGNVVRVLPDGSIDAAYAVSLDSRPIWGVQVVPDGSLLGSIQSEDSQGLELILFGARDGERVIGRFKDGWREPWLNVWWVDRVDSPVTPQQGLIHLVVSAFFGGQPEGYAGSGFLLPDGSVKGFAFGKASWAGGAAWAPTIAGAFRRFPWRETPRIGFARTGIFVSRETPSLPVRRSGSTSKSVKVRGEWRERIAGEWRSADGQTFEAEFPKGVADTSAVIRLPAGTGQSGVRELEFRMLESEEGDVADAGVCRAWVLDSGTPLVEGIRIHAIRGDDLAVDAVLSGVFTEGATLVSSPSLRGPWQQVSDTEFRMLEGVNSGWVVPLSTGTGATQFYRCRAR